MIHHVNLLCHFHHRRHPACSFMTIQFHFLRRLHLYYQSSCCLILFSSQTAPCPIGPYSLVSFLAYTTPVPSVTFLSCIVFITNRTLSNRSQQFIFIFGLYNTRMIDHVNVVCHFHHRPHASDQLWLFNFIFYVNHTFTIDQIVVLSYFYHRPHLVW